MDLGVRVTEDKVISVLERGALEVALKLGSDPVGHRNRSTWALGLWRAQLATRDASSHSDHASGPIHVAPSQRD